MRVKIKRLTDTAVIPTRGSQYSAGLDLYADEDATIPSATSRMIHTGIAMEIPEGYFGAIYARSGLSTKQGLRPATCVSVIDSDYRNEIFIPIHNDNDTLFDPKMIHKGERIAQLVIQPYLEVDFEVVGALSETERGEGGFGSTGA